jgi:hypothetical protein
VFTSRSIRVVALIRVAGLALATAGVAAACGHAAGDHAADRPTTAAAAQTQGSPTAPAQTGPDSTPDPTSPQALSGAVVPAGKPSSQPTGAPTTATTPTPTKATKPAAPSSSPSSALPVSPAVAWLQPSALPAASAYRWATSAAVEDVPTDRLTSELTCVGFAHAASARQQAFTSSLGITAHEQILVYPDAATARADYLAAVAGFPQCPDAIRAQQASAVHPVTPDAQLTDYIAAGANSSAWTLHWTAVPGRFGPGGPRSEHTYLVQRGATIALLDLTAPDATSPAVHTTTDQQVLAAM